MSLCSSCFVSTTQASATRRLPIAESASEPGGKTGATRLLRVSERAGGHAPQTPGYTFLHFARTGDFKNNVSLRPSFIEGGALHTYIHAITRQQLTKSPKREFPHVETLFQRYHMTIGTAVPYYTYSISMNIRPKQDGN